MAQSESDTTHSLESPSHPQLDGPNSDAEDPSTRKKKTPPKKRRAASSADKVYKQGNDTSDPDDHAVTKRRVSGGKGKAATKPPASRKSGVRTSTSPLETTKETTATTTTPQRVTSRKRKSVSTPNSPSSAEKSQSQKKARRDDSADVPSPVNNNINKQNSPSPPHEHPYPTRSSTSPTANHATSTSTTTTNSTTLYPSSPSSPRKISDPSTISSLSVPSINQSNSLDPDYEASSSDDEAGKATRKSPDRRPSQNLYKPDDDDDNGNNSGDGLDADDVDIEPTPERVQREAAISALERAARARMAEREARRINEFSDLKPQEYKLFATIDHRGFEPFLPLAWHLDFPYKVDTFFGESRGTTHINSVDFEDGNANFRASRALSNLMKIGPIVRDRYLIMHRRPEPWISKQIRTYMKWAERDSGSERIQRVPPILSIAFDDAKEGVDSDKVVKRIERRMRQSAREWRAWLRENPDEEVEMEDGEEEGMEGEEEEEESPGDQKEADGANTREEWEGRQDRRDSKGKDGGEGGGRRGSGILKWVWSLFGRGGKSGDDVGKEGEDSDAASSGAASRDARYNVGKSVDCVYGIAVSHLVVAILSYSIYGSEGEDEDEDEDDEESESGDKMNVDGENEDDEDDDEYDENSYSYDTDDIEGYVYARAIEEVQREQERGGRKKKRRGARIIFYVDYAKSKEDVWNSVAIAMAVCHCRDLRLAQSQKLDQDDDDGGGDDEVEMEVDEDV